MTKPLCLAFLGLTKYSWPHFEQVSKIRSLGIKVNHDTMIDLDRSRLTHIELLRSRS